MVGRRSFPFGMAETDRCYVSQFQGSIGVWVFGFWMLKRFVEHIVIGISIA